MKHSHNDYWCEHQVHGGLNAECNIIEIDVIYLEGELYLSHSWRPFGSLTYGDPEKYFKTLDRCSGINAKNIYLYVEIKTSNKKAVPLLVDLFVKYKNLNIVIDGKNKWFSSKRFYVALEACWEANLSRKKHIGWFGTLKKQKNIESLDLYKSSKYKFWNRW